MPLTRAPGEPIVDTWGVHFNMLLPSGMSVQCTVTRGALDELVKGNGNTTVGEQTAMFAQWRDVIESVANLKYEVGKLDHSMVVIAPDDLTQFIRADPRRDR